MSIHQIISNPQTIFVVQIFIAAAFGGLIGLQREISGKSAGPRTHALICAGATLFTILSLNFFSSNNALVASAVVSSVGFLGFGTILHKENRVFGLTTAVDMWISAAIGMAIATQQYIVAMATTALILIVLSFNDRKFHKK